MHDAAHPTVVFAGGGTGGHLYPALALADAVVSIRPDVRPVFVGAERGLEARVLRAQGRECLLLPVRGFARGSVLGVVGALAPLARSLDTVVGWMRGLKPAAVVVTGGYAGGPAGAAAALHAVPLILQEQNAVPGVTTRVLARWARQIHVAFPQAVERLPRGARSRAVVSGNPVRPPAAVSREDARAALGLPPEGVVLLVAGGSQGSAALNRALLQALPPAGADVPPALTVLWSTGPAHHAGVEAGLRDLGSPRWVRAVPYIDDMPTALAAADVALSRAGAMATAEFLNQGLPAILVPLPTAAADHQARNARALEEAGAARVIEETALEPLSLWREIERLCADAAVRADMSRRAAALARPHAARAIARAITAVLPPGRAA